MITQDCKVNPRELEPLVFLSSFMWHKLQIIISFLLWNLIILSVVPYLASWAGLSTVLFTVFCILLLNAALTAYWRNRRFIPVKSELSCKAGIWKLQELSAPVYGNLRGEILVWQWIIIIPLYLPAKNTIQRLILLNDSVSPQDLARLRRWLKSEFI